MSSKRNKKISAKNQKQQEKVACSKINEMASHCFDKLIGHITSKPVENGHLPLIKMPLFVTWYKYDEITKKYELRGCIGTFEKDDPL